MWSISVSAASFTPNSHGTLTVDDGSVLLDSSDFMALHSNLQQQINNLDSQIIEAKEALRSAIETKHGVIGSSTVNGLPTFAALVDGINSIPNVNTDTYVYSAGSTGSTVDMGASNNYRYVNATEVYLKGKADQHTEDANSGYVQPTETKVITANGSHNVSNAAVAVVNVPIPSGYLVPDGTRTLTSNGTFDVSSYKNVDVNVPIPSGYLKPSGNKTITTNGSYIDVSSYSTVTVSVPVGTTPSGTKTITSNGNYDVTDYATASVNVSASDSLKITVVLMHNVSSACELKVKNEYNSTEYNVFSYLEGTNYPTSATFSNLASGSYLYWTLKSGTWAYRRGPHDTFSQRPNNTKDMKIKFPAGSNHLTVYVSHNGGYQIYVTSPALVTFNGEEILYD